MNHKVFLLHVVLLVVVLGYSKSPAQESQGLASLLGKAEVTEKEAYEAGSLYDAYLSNLLAWEKGDCLIRVATNLDSIDIEGANDEPGDIVSESIQLHRFRFDNTQQKYFYVHVDNVDIALIAMPDSDTDVVETSRQRIQGFVFNENGKFGRSFPRKVVKLNTNLSANDAFRKMNVPELRMTGLLKYGNSIDFVGIEAVLNKLSTGQGIVEIRDIASNKLQIVRETNNPQIQDVVFHTTSTFDTERFVPLKRLIEVTNKRKEDSPRSVYSLEKYTWKELNGTMVPIAIQSEDKSSRMVGGTRHVMKRTVDVGVHWFSFNEELPVDAFDEITLHDIDQIIKVTDPQASGAETLVMPRQ
jgi:hypothetical protein